MGRQEVIILCLSILIGYFANLNNNQFDFTYTPIVYADKAIRNILKT